MGALGLGGWWVVVGGGVALIKFTGGFYLLLVVEAGVGTCLGNFQNRHFLFLIRFGNYLGSSLCFCWHHFCSFMFFLLNSSHDFIMFWVGFPNIFEIPFPFAHATC